mgnify:CR=1 FL=1
MALCTRTAVHPAQHEHRNTTHNQDHCFPRHVCGSVLATTDVASSTHERQRVQVERHSPQYSNPNREIQPDTKNPMKRISRACTTDRHTHTHTHTIEVRVISTTKHWLPTGITKSTYSPTPLWSLLFLHSTQHIESLGRETHTAPPPLAHPPRESETDQVTTDTDAHAQRRITTIHNTKKKKAPPHKHVRGGVRV